MRRQRSSQPQINSYQTPLPAEEIAHLQQRQRQRLGIVIDRRRIWRKLPGYVHSIVPRTDFVRASWVVSIVEEFQRVALTGFAAVVVVDVGRDARRGHGGGARCDLDETASRPRRRGSWSPRAEVFGLMTITLPTEPVAEAFRCRRRRGREISCDRSKGMSGIRRPGSWPPLAGSAGPPAGPPSSRRSRLERDRRRWPSEIEALSFRQVNELFSERRIGSGEIPDGSLDGAGISIRRDDGLRVRLELTDRLIRNGGVTQGQPMPDLRKTHTTTGHRAPLRSVRHASNYSNYLFSECKLLLDHTTLGIISVSTILHCYG